MPIPASAFGHGDFIQVRAELVRVTGGAAEAILAALIFWRTKPDHRKAYERDGMWWWNATRTELADGTGLSVEQVRRAGEALIFRGFIAAAKHQIGGVSDTSFSYAVLVENPQWSESQTGLGSPTGTTGENPKPSSLKKEKNNTQQRATRMPNDLTWNNGHALKAGAKGVDVEVEFQKFTDHHLANGSTFVDWDRAFHSWLNRARPELGRGSQGPVRRPTPTERMDAIMNIPDPNEGAQRELR